MGSVSRQIRRNKVREFMRSKKIERVNRKLAEYWSLIKHGFKKVSQTNPHKSA